MEDGFFIDGAGEKLLIDIVEAETGDGVCKAFTGDAFVAEQEDGLLHDLHDLLLACENFGQRRAVGDSFAPTTADIDLEAVLVFLQCAEGTLALAATAVVAGVGIDVTGQLASIWHFLQP